MTTKTESELERAPLSIHVAPESIVSVGVVVIEAAEALIRVRKESPGTPELHHAIRDLENKMRDHGFKTVQIEGGPKGRTFNLGYGPGTFDGEWLQFGPYPDEP